jgi:glycosyltransferase involved in cell wall biosynthesis
MARVVILWTSPTSYVAAGATSLARADNGQHRVSVVFVDHDELAPVETSGLSGFNTKVHYSSPRATEAIRGIVEEANPDLVLFCGWHIPAYRDIARTLRGHTVRVLYFDNQWHATPKQYLARTLGRRFIARRYDYAYLPGERQAHYARLLGIPEDRIELGGCPIDDHTFRIDTAEAAQSNSTFLFVGRLVPVKGIDVLLEAYRIYRSESSAKWDLVVCGGGPHLPAEEGLRQTGFLQPQQVSTLMANAGALILPSRFEPWGVALHEGAMAGLPLLASSAVGSADKFVRQSKNGYVHDAGDSVALGQHMLTIERASPEWRGEAASLSRTLAQTITADTWADGLIRLAAR